MTDLEPFHVELLPTKLEDVRHFIDCVERALRECSTLIEVPLVHYFSHNVYAREMKLSATTLLVGRIHKFENLNILSEGEASVFSIDGVYRFKAPHTFVGSRGAKRVIYAHSDLTWTTILGTSLKNVDNIEDKFTCLKYSDLGG